MAKPPKVLVDESRRKKVAAQLEGDTLVAWRAAGWFGLLLAVVGLGDIALLYLPFRLGSPEWEFATVAASLAGLPLPTMGLAAMLAAAIGTGSRRSIKLLGWLLIVFSVGVLGEYVLFLTNVPLALGGTPEELLVGVWRTVAKTTLLAFGFSAAYLFLGIGALRFVRTRS